MSLVTESSSKHVIVESVGRATVIQPDNRKWTITIKYIDDRERIIPLFIIIEGKIH